MSENRKIQSLLVFENSMFAAFSGEEQVPELQSKSAIELWIEDAVAKGFDVDGCEVRCGRFVFEVRKKEDGTFAVLMH